MKQAVGHYLYILLRGVDMKRAKLRSDGRYRYQDQPRGYVLRRAPGAVAKGGSRYAGRNNRVRGSFPEEIKYFDGEDNLANIVEGLIYPPTNSSLNLIRLGNGNDDRDGKNVLMRSIGVKYDIRLNPVESFGATMVLDSSNDVEVRLIMDTQPNGTNPTLPQLMQNYAAGKGLRQFNNMEEGSRFVTLKSQKHRVEIKHILLGAAAVPILSTAAIVAYSDYVTGEMYVNLNKMVQYKSDLGTIADVQKYNFFLLVRQSKTGQGQNLEFIANWRVRYIDC